ncbi:MAG: M3 family metallopeptidase [Ancrocorticia sp.]|uniref:M3 family metallopeptidase n=1 Tax=Ancrocorticia sp. TaxID=2593684 RepID=UPI003F906ED0
MTSTLRPLTLPAPEDTATWLRDRATEGLARVRQIAQELKSAPPADALGVLQAWNALQIELSNVQAPASTFAQLHSVAEARAMGDAVDQETSQVSTALWLDADLYRVFAGLDPAGLDDDATRLLEHTLRDFRRSGVDKDEETRQRLAAIDNEMVRLGQQIEENTRNDVREIALTPDRLVGLPQDWIDSHQPGADGLVRVNTEYPDLVPFSTYAHDDAARRELKTASLNRGWPVNDALLKQLFGLRSEYAQILGYANWAEYDAEDKMIGSGAAIGEFIEKISALALPSAQRDYAVLLERMRQDNPQAQSVDTADSAYYAERVRTEQYGVDSQEVRRYFDFTKVRDGLLEVTGKLFGLTYTPAEDAVLWHEDVTSYDVHLGETYLGRIYLDLHPRDGKFSHAAQFDLTSGVTGIQVAEGVLGCNLGRGLIEHDDAVTLFHEFGHLVHHLLGGQTPWVEFSGVATEWDFVEAPSQMLEEWAWDPGVLASFATDSNGEPIPSSLVARMRNADDYGKGFLARTQMFYAALSYAFHTEKAEDLTARTAELQEQYSLFPYIPNTHLPANFGHLVGYSSGYYTYMWSLVIAKDMFSAFDSTDMFGQKAATRYRDQVLARGGSGDAADLVADFLGRPYSFDAFGAWLAE